MTFSITILGSSSAVPTAKRYLTAQLVSHHERFFLIDCGEGTQMQLRKFFPKFTRINHIFISHLHSDHILGLFGLLSTYNMLGRKNTLHIYSDGRLPNLLNYHFNFLDEKILYPIEYHKIKPNCSEIIYEDKKLYIKTVPLKHRIPTTGFKFEEKPQPRKIKKNLIQQYGLGIKDIIAIKNGDDFITAEGMVIPNSVLTTPSPEPRSYAFCSDTKVTKSILPFIEGVNVLYHEATFLDEDKKLAKATYHSSVTDVAKLAKLANVKKLIIGHFSARYKYDNIFLEQALQYFPNTFLAEDGLTITIN